MNRLYMNQARHSQSRGQTLRVWRLGMGLIILFCGWGQTGFAVTSEQPLSKPESPVLKLSLRDAMDASVDQNPKVRLFKERIVQAQNVADTQLGTLLPNISGRLSAARRRLFFGSFGGNPSISDPIKFYEARASLTQTVLSLSLIQNGGLPKLVWTWRG